MKTYICLFAVLLIPLVLVGQEDLLISKLQFEGDFRFRIEQDWNSRMSDGIFRDDRTRLRYRLRTGVSYAGSWYHTGFRIRTGNPAKQQDPQLTLGEGFKEFGTLPIGIEKAYFQAHWNDWEFWAGKNTFPFRKTNELFWSDNVFPEGVFALKKFGFEGATIDYLDLRAGHFILSANGTTLAQDSYFQGIQSLIAISNERFKLYPAIYVFKNVPDIPDGNQNFILDYTILHIGASLLLHKETSFTLELDYYNNILDYSNYIGIPQELKDQQAGLVVGVNYGALEHKGDFVLKATYAYLERFSAVDFMAQNDWARWDYSSNGSPDGRLTNYKGLELVGGFKIDKKVNLKLKYYLVEQLIPYGIAKENGERIRLDIDVKF